MRRQIFISSFFIVQLGLIFLYLRKQEIIIALSYDKQKNEQILQDLVKQNEHALVLLEECKQTKNVKQFTKNVLHMIQLQLADIRKLPNEI